MHKKLLLLLPVFILVAVQHVFAQPEPEWFSYPGSPYNLRFDDVYFVNDSTGWLVGSDGQIFHTADYGKHWDLQLNTPEYFRSVEFFDAATGFVGSLYGKLYKTMDGGENWYEITDSLPVPFSGICGMSVADSNTIYACGVWSSPAFIFKSTDRGHTWEYINMSSYAYSLVDMQFTDALHGFATGQSHDLSEGGIILYTEDGGVSWEPKALTTHPNDYVWKIQLLNDTLCFAAIADVTGGFATRFFKSTDAGMSWDVKTVSADYYYVEMCGFINADTGWTGSYQQLETFDGGETWHENTFGDNTDRFFRLNDNLAFASGSTVYVYSDTTWIPPIDTIEDTTTVQVLNSGAVHDILDISPNPVHDDMLLTYHIARFTTVDIAMFDMLGNKVHTFYHGTIQPGDHTQTWHCDLPPGQYVVCIHSNEGLRWRKCIVQ
ncbi:MAG: YCF48-related protein [Chitinophagales bacterium]